MIYLLKFINSLDELVHTWETPGGIHYLLATLRQSSKSKTKYRNVPVFAGVSFGPTPHLVDTGDNLLKTGKH